MKITHVLRGEDHITNTARQILLFESLGLDLPSFAHFSMILGRDGSKLSKRHGSTTISQFREEGYLAEALANYLSILSWAPEEGQEIFSLGDILDKFKISGISKSPAIFDADKLNWINGIYIRKKSDKELVELCIPYLISGKIIDRKDTENEKIMDKILKGVNAFKDNLKVLGDFPLYMKDFFEEKITDYSKEADEILKLETSKTVLETFLEILKSECKSFDNNLDMDFNEDQGKEIIDRVGEQLKNSNIKGKYLYMPIRISITGKNHGPELPKVISILGLENCIQRVNQTLEYIKKSKL